MELPAWAARVQRRYDAAAAWKPEALLSPKDAERHLSITDSPQLLRTPAYVPHRTVFKAATTPTSSPRDRTALPAPVAIPPIEHADGVLLLAVFQALRAAHVAAVKQQQRGDGLSLRVCALDWMHARRRFDILGVDHALVTLAEDTHRSVPSSPSAGVPAEGEPHCCGTPARTWHACMCICAHGGIDFNAFVRILRDGCSLPREDVMQTCGAVQSAHAAWVNQCTAARMVQSPAAVTGSRHVRLEPVTVKSPQRETTASAGPCAAVTTVAAKAADSAVLPLIASFKPPPSRDDGSDPLATSDATAARDTIASEAYSYADEHVESSSRLTREEGDVGGSVPATPDMRSPTAIRFEVVEAAAAIITEASNGGDATATSAICAVDQTNDVTSSNGVPSPESLPHCDPRAASASAAAQTNRILSTVRVPSSHARLAAMLDAERRNDGTAAPAETRHASQRRAHLLATKACENKVLVTRTDQPGAVASGVTHLSVSKFTSTIQLVRALKHVSARYQCRHAWRVWLQHTAAARPASPDTVAAFWPFSTESASADVPHDGAALGPTAPAPVAITPACPCDRAWMQCVDTSSGCVYFFDAASQASEWTLPAACALHAAPASVACIECSSVEATRRCLDCSDCMCAACFTRLHYRGRKRLHRFTVVPGSSEAEATVSHAMSASAATAAIDDAAPLVRPTVRPSTHAAIIKDVWQVHLDAKGGLYFINSRTHATQTEAPAGIIIPAHPAATTAIRLRGKAAR